MKSRFPAHDTTMPVSVPESSTQTPQLITIPHELLPTLHILRSHITELTRDNEALRYTFLGGPTASPSKVTLDTPSTAQAAMEGVQGLDLRVVLGRVKELIKENEELGEMVLEAGRGSSKEWQKALDGWFDHTSAETKAHELQSQKLLSLLLSTKSMPCTRTP